MFLSNVKLVGFKSFAQKTSVDFDEGITAIVGPNGCGKTNIVDAIRWVLGEQKTSVLRGDKMESVIFNGTDKRRRTNFAEVSLIIQNTKNILPIEYSEVMISRRLFRSGDSEYLLNKEQCRLKDITSLLMDSGMGHDAYSVIELDMVKMLLNDKDDYRKRLFEEAAGISRYKARRQESLRKLDATRQDLLRVKDIITEVERSVKGLKSQVSRAKRYEKLKELLKNHEKVFYKLKRENLLDSKKPIETSIEDLTNKLDGFSGKAAKEEAQVEKARTEILEKQNVLTSAQEELDKFNEKVRQVDNSYVQVSERLMAISQRKTRLANEINVLENRIRETEDQTGTIGEELEKSTSSLKKIENELESSKLRRDKFLAGYREKKSIYLGKSQQVFDVMNQLAEKIRKRDAVKRDSRETDEKISGLNASKKSADARISDLNSQKKSAEKRVAELSGELEKLRELKKSLANKIEGSSGELSELEKKAYLMKSSYDSAKSKLDFLNRLVEDHSDMPAGVKSVLDSKSEIEGILGTVAELIDVPEEYRAAVESVLGEQANYVVVKQSKDIKKAIRNLRSSKSGRATLIALDKVPSVKISDLDPDIRKAYNIKDSILEKISYDKSLSDLLSVLLGDVFFTDSDSDEFLNKEPAADGKGSYRIVNRDGDLLSVGFIYSGGSKIEENIGIVGRKERIEELKVELAELEKKINDNEASFEKEKVERERLQDRLEETESDFELKNKISEDERTKLEVLNFDIKQTDDKLTESINGVRQLELIKKDFVEIDELEYDIKVLEKVKEKLHLERKEFQSEEEQLEEERQEIENSFVAVNSTFTQLKGSITSYEKDIGRNKRMLEDFHIELDERKVQLTDNDESLKTMTTRKTELQDELNSLIQDRKKYEDAVFLSREELASIQDKKQNELDSFLKLRNQINELRDDIHDQKEKHVSVSQELKYLEETIATKGITLTELEENLDKEYRYEDVTVNMDKYRDRIENFGPVNMEAVDEYNKEKERLTFLENQVQDLEDAEKTLVDTIDKINITASEKLINTFSQVRIYFKEIFTTFFTNGKADLTLEEGKDPLDIKVDVFAQPFGKNVQSIALLSGGEKALTAIAILFAIYKVKPSPFCILDEVDAPLDDANIARFIKMLQRFSTDTQFIVVTHNKKSMQAARNLYGVTMEETGISKLVSVRLNAKPVENEELDEVKENK
ncbi:MAG: chromosome segregation protein SMC [bacterium]|nr:chromosome segregation protein SMC [bacterium]